jgi:uncharacterized protein YigA (DUF484 family)
MTLPPVHPVSPSPVTAVDPSSLPPITEDDIAGYLTNTPDFFERHAEVLAAVQLTSPHGHRAVSLQERQAEMLREKIKALEQRIMEMMRHGSENGTIAERMQRWAVQLAGTRAAADLPQRIVDEAIAQFQVPQAAIRVWGVAPAHADQPFAQDVSAEMRTFADSLGEPYCGPNRGFEAVQWLARPAEAASLVLLPLREAEADPAAAGIEVSEVIDGVVIPAPPPPAFGLLVMASEEVERFDATMGTDFLQRMAALASAALGRLRAGT